MRFTKTNCIFKQEDKQDYEKLKLGYYKDAWLKDIHLWLLFEVNRNRCTCSSSEIS